jgi:hypothetical protein
MWRRSGGRAARALSALWQAFEVAAVPASSPAGAAALGAATAAPPAASRSHVAAAAAAAAAALWLLPAAACEAPALPADAARALAELAARLDEQLHRLEAARGGGGAPLPRLPPPEASADSSGRLRVRFRVPQELDVAGAADEAARRLRDPHFGDVEAAAGGSATDESRTSGPAGSARALRRASPALGALELDFMVPHAAGEPATVEFRGAPTADNLALLAAVMERAARPARGGGAGGFGGGFSGERGPFGALPSGLSGLLGGGGAASGLLGPFLEPLRELLEDAERSMQEAPLPGAGTGGETAPPPRRLAARAPGAGAGAAAPAAGDEADAALPPAASAAAERLRAMGAQVFLPPAGVAAEAARAALARGEVDWGGLAGYEPQKQQLEESLLLPLLRPDVYDAVARAARRRFEPNRPRAVLLAGPPGTGKTSAARAVAALAALPLVYLPLEAYVSKWYGESERALAEALAACDALSADAGAVVFLDELDALATSRGGEAGGVHEATRRLLGVLLRHVDGFDATRRSVVVGATNRPQDLDAALLSRFSATVEFGLPGPAERAAIIGQYAAQLSAAEAAALAAATPGLAGRDLRDVCEAAERRWAAALVRRGAGAAAAGAPPAAEYAAAAEARLREMAVGRGATGGV